MPIICDNTMRNLEEQKNTRIVSFQLTVLEKSICRVSNSTVGTYTSGHVTGLSMAKMTSILSVLLR